MPASRTHRATPSGVCSITTPSSSSTSAVPHFDDAARAPCLHTGTPAPATTRRGHRRHVDGVGAVTSGSDDVDRLRPLVVGQRNESCLFEHRVEEARQLCGVLPFGSQRHHEPGDLRRRRLARQDHPHRRRRIAPAQVASGDEVTDQLRPRTCKDVGGRVHWAERTRSASLVTDDWVVVNVRGRRIRRCAGADGSADGGHARWLHPTRPLSPARTKRARGRPRGRSSPRTRIWRLRRPLRLRGRTWTRQAPDTPRDPTTSFPALTQLTDSPGLAAVVPSVRRTGPIEKTNVDRP